MKEITVIIDDNNKISVESNDIPMANAACILEVARVCIMRDVVFGKDVGESK
jgi:hypothetical protein